MARWSRIEVFQTMEEVRLVPLCYHDDIDTLIKIVEACYKGGARVFEFTSRGDRAHKVFDALVEHCNKAIPDMILGVGSVTDAGQASLYMSLGANFIVTPVLREDIAIVCNRRKVMWSPGCGSLSDICRAEELGAELIKLFPGSVYGPGMIKSIKGPQPWTSIMPTGGVSTDPDNLKAWINAGASCVGMGSKLISKELVAAGAFDKLEEVVRDTVALLKTL